MMPWVNQSDLGSYSNKTNPSEQSKTKFKFKPYKSFLKCQEKRERLVDKNNHKVYWGVIHLHFSGFWILLAMIAKSGLALTK